jgi:hypothetical protein
MRRLAILTGILALALVVTGCTPRPKGKSMTQVRDEVADKVYETIATSLYERPATRQDYLNRARNDAPELWARITADHTVTLDEFRTIPAVQSAVNHYGGEIIEFFEREMVESCAASNTCRIADRR